MSTSAQSAHTSLSSGSVITVQRGSGQGPDSIHIRSASPAEGAILAARAIKASAGHRSQRNSASNDQDDSSSVEGAGSIDRSWSQSTSSTTPTQRGRSTASSRGVLEEREKPWRKGSPTASPRVKHSSPGGSPSRYKQPSSKDRLGEYLPGKVDGSRRRPGSGNSSRSTTPKLGAGALPKLKLPPRDAVVRNYVSSPLSPSAMRPLTPGNTGLLTPTSATEPDDYFGLGIAVNKDRTPRPTEASPLSPAGHSRYSNKKPKEVTESPTSDRRTSRGKERKEKDKKNMLSKALEKANTAVLLDNAQNFAGALSAYRDACKLLEHVMDRTTGPEDKAKLDAIRNTYATRIVELHALQNPQAAAEEKQLPPRPTSNGSDDFVPQLDLLSPVSPLVAQQLNTKPIELPAEVPRANAQTAGRTRDSFLTDAIRQVEGGGDHGFLGPLWERSKSPLGLLSEDSRSRDDLHSPDAPLPLTPNRSQSPQPPPKDVPAPPADAQKKEGAEPGSWLNTIDESDSDDGSSLHSAKHGALHRKDLSNGKSQLMDFDTAFDEAVEAAYEEGYEPDHGDEEQQMMDDIAKDLMDDFNFNLKSKSSIPRESASTAYTRSTWQSSVGNADRNTAATSLSTLSEDSGPGAVFPRHQPQSSTSTVQTTDSTINLPSSSFDGAAVNGTSQILERRNRLSGQSLKPLTIETASSPQRRRAPSSASRMTTNSQRELDPTPWESQEKPSEVTPWETQDKSAEVTPWETQAAPGDFKPGRMGSLRKQQDKDVWAANPSSAVSDSGSSQLGDVSSPRARYLRNQKSSVSLRETALGAMTPTESDYPTPTPTSATFPHHYTRRNDSTSHLSNRSGPTVASSSVPPLPDAGQQGGYYLFDTTLGRSIEQGLSSSPRTSKESSPPAPFEPCPDSALLRPFWLMRLISNTTTHPRGAYITTRLFMPHEAWLNRSAKLKNLEDKIAACDMLTAGLARLEEVDTYDADAVLSELQQFEEIMERVQGMLVKKLGNEVGVNNANDLFKAADKGGVDSPPDGMKESKNSGKFSWRKLRGKPSVSSTQGATNPAKTGSTESATMQTVPMTSFVGVEKRTAHRREALRDALFEGPHKDYMAAIAKLCEAVQILDQVARQVEDPGLKHSSSTHIGLEFSTRHASEFFAFYVCRFLLADIGSLIDKHVKRSTEWILA
ncbi:hypothetical protein BDZ85DRAFT_8789 [Elsinoe ampelina]|uniref:MIT domain-containing protein n=1 Tax=Elsinoe ampelina TaxID=302913 RepID=A0A6A6GQ63_9PEZI|nr:hypothetical protein BDZ85DRAFT_8789 [Elsinoe ampelina]